MSSVECRLGHKISSEWKSGGFRYGWRRVESTTYSTQFVDFILPASGSELQSVKCHKCGTEVVVKVRSQNAVRLRRVLGAATILGVLGLWYFTISSGLFITPIYLGNPNSPLDIGPAVWGVAPFFLFCAGAYFAFSRKWTLALSLDGAAEHALLKP